LYGELAEEIGRLTIRAECAEDHRTMLEAEVERLRAELADLAHEIERLLALLREARPFVSDAGNDEDPEAQRRACELLEQIDAALQMSRV
jgi:hypothetical protein